MSGGAGQAGHAGGVDLSARLVLERYRQISRALPLLYFAHAINGLAVAAASQGDFPFIYQIILPVVLVSACFWQCWLWQQRRREEVTAACAERRLKRTVAFAAALCLTIGLWALGAYLVIPYADLLLPPMFILVFALTTASCLAPLPRVPMIMLALSLTPVLTAMLLRPEDELRSVAFSIIVLAIVVARLAGQHAHEVDKTLRLQDRLERQAWQDSLTGLANRRAFATAFEDARQAAEADDELALVIVDLDGFKEANDTFGHVAGDGVLVETASRLHQLFPDAQLIARFGGDEFVLLFAGPGRADWQERIAAAARVMAMPVADGLHTIPISASFGLAQASADSAHLDRLLIAADEELYSEKARRRSQVRRRA